MLDALSKGLLSRQTVERLQKREAKAALLGCGALLAVSAYVFFSHDQVVVRAEGEKKPKLGAPRQPETGSFKFASPPFNGKPQRLQHTLTHDELSKHEAMEDKVWDVMFWSVME